MFKNSQNFQIMVESNISRVPFKKGIAEEKNYWSVLLKEWKRE